MAKDLEGQKFNMLTVIKETAIEDRVVKKQKNWYCLCECGGTKIATSRDITSGRTQSCGCIINKELTGQRFGKLYIEGKSLEKAGIAVLWDCLCDCGNRTRVRSISLTTGDTKSCGCLVSKSLVGQKFGKLNVLNKTTKRKSRQVVWNCLCDCGNYIEVPTNSLTRKNTQSCGCFSDSRGEYAIRGYLELNRIAYKSEYSFEDLYDKSANHPLRFDFALFNTIGQLVLLLEYDGLQHFESSEYFGGEDTLNAIRARDAMKNKYCKEHHIPLVRVPYTSYNNLEETLYVQLPDLDLSPCMVY